MDVALVLTHRCNFACGYCYAGEHHKTDIDDDVLARGVDLLFADNAETVQLSFFGGEPFLAFDAMKRAVERAETEARARGRRLLLACTTNGSVLDAEKIRFVREHGMRVTVSIDGIEEAHDRNRPRAGGGGSFTQAHGGLRRLLDAGVACDAMMVITPETAEHAYLSVSFLWGEGVRTVRANVALARPWSIEAGAELSEQLVSIGWELLARRMRGEPGGFEPFEHAIRAAAARTGARSEPARARVVVATSGNLYPCSPMVGPDRDAGPEARVRIGHLDDGAASILTAVRSEGVRCHKGGSCECAAYLETGDRKTPGPMGRWYAAVCDQVGTTVAEGLAAHEAAHVDRASRRSKRRPFLAGLAAIVGAAAIATPFLVGALGEEPALRPCQLRERKQVGATPVDIDEEIAMPGEMPALPPPPPPPPEPEILVDGDIGEPL